MADADGMLMSLGSTGLWSQVVLRTTVYGDT